MRGGGATIARYLGRGSKKLKITRVSSASSYTTCFFSNLYLSGFRSLRSLTHDYARLNRSHGVEVVIDRALSIDRDTRTIRLAGGGEISYDRLVLSPGISFRPNAIEGYDAAAWQATPHAYTAGHQTFQLRRRLLAPLCPAGPAAAQFKEDELPDLSALDQALKGVEGAPAAAPAPGEKVSSGMPPPDAGQRGFAARKLGDALRAAATAEQADAIADALREAIGANFEKLLGFSVDYFTIDQQGAISVAAN